MHSSTCVTAVAAGLTGVLGERSMPMVAALGVVLLSLASFGAGLLIGMKGEAVTATPARKRT
jgi:hypothetical protein